MRIHWPILFLIVIHCSSAMGVDLTVGRVAPEMEVKLLESGQTFKLSRQTGKTVIINFWASWCAPCKAEMPVLQAFFDKHKSIQRRNGHVGDAEISAAELESLVTPLLVKLALERYAGTDGKDAGRRNLDAIDILINRDLQVRVSGDSGCHRNDDPRREVNQGSTG